MNKQLIIRMALGIRDAANSVYCKGRENWTQLEGIMNTAEAIIAEVNKQNDTEVRDG